MIRVGTQLTFCSPTNILRRMVVEQDDDGVITQLFSLDGGVVESSQTLFFDGVLSTNIMSLKQRVKSQDLERLIFNYQYVDASVADAELVIIPSSKPLLLDFGSDDSYVINRVLTSVSTILTSFSIFEIIAACTYFPALLLRQPAELTPTACVKLMLWENVDLINKQITQQTCVRLL